MNYLKKLTIYLSIIAIMSGISACSSNQSTSYKEVDDKDNILLIGKLKLTRQL